jgi:hypothetical protein
MMMSASVESSYFGANESASSGVTGHVQYRDMNDSGLRIALFMQFLAFGSLAEARWLSGAISDVRCPIAARVRKLNSERGHAR